MGFRFYCPDRHTKFVEMRHAVFLEDEMVRGSRIPREITLEEKRVCAPMPMIQKPRFSVPVLTVHIVHMTVNTTTVSTVQETIGTIPVVDFCSSRMTAEGQDVYEPSIHVTPEPIHVEQPVITEVPPRQPIVYIRRSRVTNDVEIPAFEEPAVTREEEWQQPPIQDQDVPHVEPTRRSQQTRRPAISNDYEVYSSEEIQMEGDPTSFKEAMRSAHSSKWLEAMKNEMRSMSANKVWDLERIPNGTKIVGCKWIYRMKYDSKGNVEKFKARLMAKGFMQREGVDYNEIFSPVSYKDSFRIIMALVAHYDLELHQMDVKTTFLNGDLYENVYMTQSKGFVVEGKENMRCHLKKFIYELK
jgi:hypothetical protein